MRKDYISPAIAEPLEPYYKVSKPTAGDIYAMCMESQTSDQFAKWLCDCAGVAFPPVNDGVAE